MSNQRSLLPLIVASFVTLILLNGHLASGSGQGHFSRDARFDRVCGRKLSAALMDACKGSYNPIFKRPFQKIENEYHLLKDGGLRREFKELYFPILAFGHLPVHGFPIISKSKALSITSGENFRRQRKGVVEDCCLSPCNKETLQLYCGGN